MQQKERVGCFVTVGFCSALASSWSLLGQYFCLLVRQLCGVKPRSHSFQKLHVGHERSRTSLPCLVSHFTSFLPYGSHKQQHR